MSCARFWPKGRARFPEVVPVLVHVPHLQAVEEGERRVDAAPQIVAGYERQDGGDPNQQGGEARLTFDELENGGLLGVVFLRVRSATLARTTVVLEVCGLLRGRHRAQSCENRGQSEMSA